ILGGEFKAIADAKREEARARQKLAASVLPLKTDSGLSAAYHVWLPTGRTAEAFALDAREGGVIVTPGSAFYLGSGTPPAAVRISLSAARDRAELKTALEKLRQILDSSGADRGARL